MSNQNTKSIPKAYDANDMIDAHACAEDTLNNISALMSAIKHEEERMRDYLAKVYGMPKGSFDGLRRLTNIAHIMVNEHADYYGEQARRYEKELDNIEGGSHNA